MIDTLTCLYMVIPLVHKVTVIIARYVSSSRTLPLSQNHLTTIFIAFFGQQSKLDERGFASINKYVEMGHEVAYN